MIEQFMYAKLNGFNNIKCFTPNVQINNMQTQCNNKFVNYAITSGNLVKLDVYNIVGCYLLIV